MGIFGGSYCVMITTNHIDYRVDNEKGNGVQYIILKLTTYKLNFIT